MPYTKEEYREEVDNAVSDIINYLNLCSDREVDGDINYIITRIVVEGCLGADGKMSYTRGSNMIKALECSKLEIYRRLLGPYEDAKVFENGDVSSFKGVKQQIETLLDILRSKFKYEAVKKVVLKRRSNGLQ